MSDEPLIDDSLAWRTANGPVLLVAVSEYGEFHSLFSLCDRVADELKLHPVFVFDFHYAKSRDHGRLIESRGWSWTRLGSKEASFILPSDLKSEGGYLQIEPSKKKDLRKGLLKVAVPEQDFRYTGKPVQQTKITSSLGLLRATYRDVHSRLRGVDPKNPNQRGRRLNGLFVRRFMSRQLKAARQLTRTLDARLIVSGQDFAASVTSYLAAAATQIPVAIIPFSMPPTTKELIESFNYLGTNRLESWQTDYLMSRYPQWVNTLRGVNYSRLPMRAVVAAEALGVAPSLPWTPNSGRGVIFAPSQQGMEYYEKSGIAPEQLLLTGAEWNDQFTKSASTRLARRQALLDNAKADLNGRRKKNPVAASRLRDVQRLVIISWPPNQYPRSATGAETFEELCTQFVQALSGIQEAGLAHVLVSLHPTLQSDKLSEMIRNAGLYLQSEALIDTVDCADVFCATVSSTCFWALQCGIPTINFDGYLYNYSEFDAAGAMTVQSPFAMQKAIVRLLSDPAEYKATEKKIRKVRDYWTINDGKSRQRILDGLRDLIN